VTHSPAATGHLLVEGFSKRDEERAMVEKAIWVELQAKNGKEGEVEEFLRSGEQLVGEEPDTIAWFAVDMGEGRYGIFDVFNDDAGREAHMNGKVAAALMDKAPDLFESSPKIDQPDVIGSKLPG
jgi:quinol monooxygenase YgiN